MIGMLNGVCLMTGAGEAIIDVNGVGYLVQCGSRTLGNMVTGQSTCVHVETNVRETAITLYGFGSEEDRAWFVRLQSIHGVGPKAALAILDILSPGEILSAASLGDKAAFARASGVGPKLAARITTELSGKPPPAGRSIDNMAQAMSTEPAIPYEGLSDLQLRNDAASALENLGIGQSDAIRAVATAFKTFDDEPGLDTLIRAALKEMSK